MSVFTLGATILVQLAGLGLSSIIFDVPPSLIHKVLTISARLETMSFPFLSELNQSGIAQSLNSMSFSDSLSAKKSNLF